MKKSAKKSLSLLLCVAMVFANMMTALVFAQEADAPQGDFAVDTTEPEITLESETGHIYSTYYCEPPKVTVTDAGGNLSYVTVEFTDGYGKPAKTERIEAGENRSSFTFDLADYVDYEILNGQKTTITAVDDAGEEGNKDVLVFYLGHAFKTMQRYTYSATCVERSRSITVYICRGCEDRYSYLTSEYKQGDERYGEKKPHNYETQTVDLSACGGEGTKEWNICKDCGYGEIQNQGSYTDPEDGKHQWETKTLPTTCTQGTYTWQECSVCHDKKDFVFDTKSSSKNRSSGHVIGPFVTEEQGSCSPDGGKFGKMVARCKYCDFKLEQLIGGTNNHTWKYNVVLEQSTCTKKGKMGQQCSVCGLVKEDSVVDLPLIPHDYAAIDGNCTNGRKCKVCQHEEKTAQHDLVYQYNENGHYQYCMNEGCTYNTKEENGGQMYPHTNPPTVTNCTTSWKCADCGYEVTGQPSHILVWKSDGTFHWQQCEREGCGYQTDKKQHDIKDDKNCVTEEVCPTCQYVVNKAGEHNWSPHASYTVGQHWYECLNEGCNQRKGEGYHTLLRTNNCMDGIKCECGYQAYFGALQHNFKNAPWEGDETGHWQECVNGNCTVTSVPIPHVGGTATCRDKAICITCGKEYGKLNPENHVGGSEIRNQKNATLTDPGYSGDEVCLGCEEILVKGHEIPKLEPEHVHTYETRYDDNGSWDQCTECEDRINEKPHTLTDYFTNEHEHWKKCETCNYETTHTIHEAIESEATDQDCTTPVHCKYCGYVMEAAKEHQYDKTWATDGTHHWHVCTNAGCGQTSEKLAHDAQDDGDCTTEVRCKTCDMQVKAAEPAHQYSTVWEKDKDGHYQKCMSTGCEQVNRQEHIPVEDDHLCTTPVVCSVCQWEITPAQEHDFTGSYLFTETGHYHACRNQGCEAVETEQQHNGGTATCKSQAVCADCGQPYGSLNADNHEGGKEVRGYIAPTTETPGFTGNTYCLGCDAVLEEGTVLDVIPPEHVHDFDRQGEDAPVLPYIHDDVEHWKECSCGVRSKEEPHTYGDWQYDNTHHFKECSVCGRVEKESHVYVNGNCSVCGMAAPEHDHIYIWHFDEQNHWRECTVCNIFTEPVAHSGNPATCISEAVCQYCSQVYGPKDSENHVGGTELREYKEPTKEAEGYSGDTYCLGCGECIEKGTTLEKLPEEMIFEATGEETVLKSYNGDDEVVKVPDKADGKPVTEIGENAFAKTQVKEVVLPDGIRRIGKNAFEGCVALQTVTIPDSVTEIAEDAFAGSQFVTIHCSFNSRAHQYAIVNGIAFRLSQDSEVRYYGDVDLDGEVTIQDALSILRCVVGIPDQYLDGSSPVSRALASEENKKEKLEVTDALNALKILVGVKQPVEYTAQYQ